MSRLDALRAALERLRAINLANGPKWSIAMQNAIDAALAADNTAARAETAGTVTSSNSVGSLGSSCSPLEGSTLDDAGKK